VLAPLQEFLARHAEPGELDFFADLQGLHAEHPLALIPAFLVTELGEALQISLLILVPFVLVDLCRPGAGADGPGWGTQTQPLVGLPLKIALFLAVGGWDVIVRGLVEGYCVSGALIEQALRLAVAQVLPFALAAGGGRLLIGLIAQRLGLHDPTLVLLARAAAVLAVLAVGGPGWLAERRPGPANVGADRGDRPGRAVSLGVFGWAALRLFGLLRAQTLWRARRGSFLGGRGCGRSPGAWRLRSCLRRRWDGDDADVAARRGL
jgi:hypothetical protein